MFDYYYGNEAEQFSFLRIPMFLLEDEAFASLTSDAVILYSKMLDRISLSVKNGWIDEQNRVYIIFTHEEGKRLLKCGNEKCTKVFDSLESVGLISRQKQGQGCPALIYVKNFIHETEKAESEQSDISDETALTSVTSENRKSRLPKSRSQDFGKSEVKTSEKTNSRLRKIGSLDFGKSVAIKTDNNQTDFYSDPSVSHANENSTERTDEKNLKEKIKENIGYDVLAEKFGTQLAEEITDLITDVTTGAKKIYISGHAVPDAVAKERFMRLDCDSVAAVTEKFSRQQKIKNPDVYICTMLYNAASTSGIAALAGSKASNKSMPSFDLSLIMEHAKNSKPVI